MRCSRPPHFFYVGSSSTVPDRVHLVRVRWYSQKCSRQSQHQNTALSHLITTHICSRCRAWSVYIGCTTLSEDGIMTHLHKKTNAQGHVSTMGANGRKAYRPSHASLILPCCPPASCSFLDDHEETLSYGACILL